MLAKLSEFKEQFVYVVCKLMLKWHTSWGHTRVLLSHTITELDWNVLWQPQLFMCKHVCDDEYKHTRQQPQWFTYAPIMMVLQAGWKDVWFGEAKHQKATNQCRLEVTPTGAHLNLGKCLRGQTRRMNRQARHNKPAIL